MYEFFQDIIRGLWFILPAYAASSFAVVSGGRFVIDFNKKLFGKRIFGNGKTFSGFFGGVFAGGVIGFLLGSFDTGLVIASGAMIGDLAGSFIKRRLGFERGASVLLLDQLDFVAGALVFGYLIIPDVLPSITAIIFILILTPFLHLFANKLAHAWKLKKRPW
ncbi:MAG: hypothetical protein CVT90_01200 [Candidatus Altiarchaeales archaeon HGW-Altiarchaeales-3]|nr:MAG: hypothetical protein CVT90_01200 [Candidatus Altiarchaeales archaeon HGW-Altiarchaeales-3]